MRNEVTKNSDTLIDYRFPPIELLKNRKCELSGISVRELDENIR